MTNQELLQIYSTYLPYDLRIARFTHGGKFKRIEYSLRGTNIDEVVRYHNLKPILRPLSDLTKEIEHNGEKFVPLIKLFTLYETNQFNSQPVLKRNKLGVDIISCKHNKYEFTNKEDFVIKFSVETSNVGTLVKSFAYDPELKRFAMRDESNRKALGLAFQFDMFQKFFEWHFDVFGLLDQNLAINLNEVK